MNSKTTTIIKKNQRRKNPRKGALTPAKVFSSTFNYNLPISNRVRTCLRYKDSFTVSLAAAAAGNTQFNLNSLYDPYYTGTGHQPYKFDQLTPSIYTRYRVYYCAWKVAFGSAGSTMFYTVVPTNGDLATAVTGAASFNGAGELPYAKSDGTGSGGCPLAIFEGGISLNMLAGYTVNEYEADDRFQAQYNASPTELMLLNICYYWPSALGTADVHFQVELCYDAELMDPPISAMS